MADTDKTYEILNYYGLKTNIEDTKKWIKQYVAEALTGITTDLMTNVTYNELVSLRDNNNLKPGMLYRMTDYVTKVYSEDGSVSSAEHPFDLILFANTTNSLNENAFACLNSNSDGYFDDSNLNGWEVKYSLYNDDARFDFGSVRKEVTIEGYKGFVAENYDESEEAYYYNGYYYLRDFDYNGKKIYAYVDTYIDAPQDFEDWLKGDDKKDVVYNDTLWFDDEHLVAGNSYGSNNRYYCYQGFLLSDGFGEYGGRGKGKNYDNATNREIGAISIRSAITSVSDTLVLINDNHKTDTVYYFKDEGLNENTTFYEGELNHSDRVNGWYDLTAIRVKFIKPINAIYDDHSTKGLIVVPSNVFEKEDEQIIIGENGKGVIYYMKDEYNNEAPFDFKNILQKDEEYTFGNNGEDYSLNGYVNGIYNNKILPCINSETGKQTINKIRVTGDNCNTNIFKPTCVNSYIDFPISECDISMNDDGELVIFKTQDFISGIENKPIEHDYRKDYLTFEAVNDNTDIIFKTYTDDPQYTKTIEVSKDKVNWETKTSSSEGVILATLNAGEKLYLRGNNSSYAYYDDNAGEYLPNFILPLNDCYVYGNVMSLIDSNNFRTLTEITDDYALYSLFCDYFNGDYSGEYVLSHEDKKLELPATTLANYCYQSIFFNCNSLTTAPELPATTLASYCYQSMFYNCNSLTTAPVLPATTLASYCYESMFRNCTSLTTAPELPATTLTDGCYSGMFNGCSRLTTAPELPATTLANYCYNGMFNGCTSLTTAPELSATTLADWCCSGMFKGCTNLTTAPELPATTLASNCYTRMFVGCTSLTTVPELPATTLASRCYYYMFSDCTSLETAPELPATTLAKYCYYYMFSNCTSLNYIKCLAINGINTNNSTDNWVNGVQTNSGTFIKHPDVTDWPTGNNGIPTNWTVEDAVIE